MEGSRLTRPGYAHQLYSRQRAVCMVAIDAEEWWEGYTIHLRLYDKATKTTILSVSHNLTARFDTDVTGTHNYDPMEDVEYDGVLILAPPTHPAERPKYFTGVGSERDLRLWIQDPHHLHAECFLQDDRTGRMALLYRTSARDVAVGRRIDEDSMDGRNISVEEVFKPSTNQEADHDVWVRLQYTFGVHTEVGTAQHRDNLAVVPLACSLLAEGLVRKPRPYAFESGEEWQSVREWVEGMEWH